MPSKFWRAIGAVKDQTSIGLAKVSRRSGSSSDLEVAVLKATSHDEVPIEQSHINEVLLLAASSPVSAAALVHALSRRMTRTHNWVVALKSLVLVFRALRDGGPHFPREALATGRRGPRLLDLSGFRDESGRSSPWDFTSFVRTFALYLDARLESFLLGKLHHHHQQQQPGSRISNMKPPMVLDRIGHWQRLLNLAIGTRPTGPAKHNRLIQISLYSVVRESFDLYRDVSDGLSMLLDNFFNLQHSACLETFRACNRAAKQFDELDSFYGLCKKTGVGRTSEYPSVQKISKDLLETLEEFLKDHQVSSMSPAVRLRSPPKLLPWSPTRRHSDDCRQSWDWESATSDQNWVPEGQARPASSSNSNDGAVSDPVLVDGQRKASPASSFDGWELVLVKSARASNSVEGLKASPSSESLWNRPSSHHRLPESYNNPFLHDENERSLVVLPPPPSPAPLPTFRGAKPNEEKNRPPTFRTVKSNEVMTPTTTFQVSSKPDEVRIPSPTFRAIAMPKERDPFGTPLDGDPFESQLIHDAQIKSSSSSSTTLVEASDEKARQQQQLLREQQMWMQQQSKIIAKIGLIT